MIWGRVLKHDGKSVPKLYWTLSQDVALRKISENYEPTQQLKLPEVFWDDLNEVLTLLVATMDADFNARWGHYTADKLQPFIRRVQQLVATQRSWSAQQLAPIKFTLGAALCSLGEQTDDNESLLWQSIDAYRSALQGYTRERAPLDWAATQNGLGNALSTLGFCNEGNAAQLEAAIAAYQNALLERTRERAPLEWARTQSDLGNALAMLGRYEGDTARLEAAVVAYHKARWNAPATRPSCAGLTRSTISALRTGS